MKGKRLKMFAAAALLGALAVPAALAQPSADMAKKPRVIRVVIGEFYFTPKVIQLKAGERVTIVFTNRGKIDHEFMAGRKVKMEHGMPEGYKNDFFRGIKATFTGNDAEFENKPGHGIEVYFEAGGSGKLTFTVPKSKTGKWGFGCFIPGHYQAGQKGTLIVK